MNGKVLHVQEVEATAAPATSSKTPVSAQADDYDHDAHDVHHPAVGKIAGILAHGYTLGDNVIQAAIKYDAEKGISPQFLASLDRMDIQAGKMLGHDQPLSDTAKASVEKMKQQAASKGTGDWFRSCMSHSGAD